jgi:hypothetical protein
LHRETKTIALVKKTIALVKKKTIALGKKNEDRERKARFKTVLYSPFFVSK